MVGQELESLEVTPGPIVCSGIVSAAFMPFLTPLTLPNVLCAFYAAPLFLHGTSINTFDVAQCTSMTAYKLFLFKMKIECEVTQQLEIQT